MIKKTKLYLATNGFPWGKGEKSFITPEIPYLLDRFDLVIISKVSKEVGQQKEYRTELDKRIKVVKYNARPLSKREIINGSLKAIFSLTMIKEIVSIIHERENIKVRVRESLSFFLHAKRYAKWIEDNKVINKNEKTIFYSYWSSYYHLAATMLKEEYPLLKVVSRMHGMDLYNERYIGGRQPFKKIMDLNSEKLIFACKYGMCYYIQHFVDVNKTDKYEVCRLGTEKIERKQNKSQEDSFCLVSCSNVIPLKRVEIIVDALSRINDLKIKWIHFGDGDNLEGIKKRASEKLADNITLQFMGHVDNQKIREFYEKYQVDCFITTSSTEGGCPVSITEAMSASIPVIGTSVGGISEMIDGNGVLLPPNPTIEEVEAAIRKIYSVDDEQRQQMCNRSLEIWKRFFDEKNNAKHVVGILEEVLE